MQCRSRGPNGRGNKRSFAAIRSFIEHPNTPYGVIHYSQISLHHQVRFATNLECRIHIRVSVAILLLTHRSFEMAICCHYRSANSYFARWWVEGGFASEPNPNRTEPEPNREPYFWRTRTRTLDSQKLRTRTRTRTVTFFRLGSQGSQTNEISITSEVKNQNCPGDKMVNDRVGVLAKGDLLLV